MEDDEYAELAGQLLESIVSQVEEVDISSNIDIDYDGDMLTLDTAKGKYIINKHNSAKEIWMVSPISGPHHFHFHDESWVNDQEEDILMVLSEEFRQHVSINIKFSNLSLVT